MLKIVYGTSVCFIKWVVELSSLSCIRRGGDIEGQEQKRKIYHIIAVDQSRWVIVFSLIALAGIVYFLVVVGLLHFLRPDYNPINHAVSNYAIGPFGFLMTSAFYVFALSVIAMAAGLFFSIAINMTSRVAILLLCLASFGIVVMGIFPGDAHALYSPATITGVIHWTSAALSFLCIMVAAFLLSSIFKTDVHFQRFQRPCFVMALAMVGALLLYGLLAFVGWTGIGQRIYLAICLLWLLLLAGWIWSSSRRQILG